MGGWLFRVLRAQGFGGLWFLRIWGYGGEGFSAFGVLGDLSFAAFEAGKGVLVFKGFRV